MNTKGLFAAALCGVILLTGCDDAGHDQSANNTVSSQPQEVSEDSEVMSADSSESTLQNSSVNSSKESSSSSIKAEPVSVPVTKTLTKPVITRIYSFADNVIKIDADAKLSNNVVGFRVFCSSSPSDIGDCVFDKSQQGLLISKPPAGVYYYRVQTYDKNEESEISEPYRYALGGSQTSHAHRYTHTFSAPNGVVVVPDYDDANADINRGKQPTSFDANIYYVCPYCGRESYFGTRTFDYCDDSRAFYVKAYCTINNCFGYNDKKSFHTIYCYTTQVS